MVARSLSIEDGNLSGRSIITSRNKLYSDIDLFFVNRPSGDVYKKFDAAAVRQAVKNILLTNHLEKPFQPIFGAGLNKFLFELTSEELSTQVKFSVETSLKNYEPRAQLKSVKTRVLPDNNSIRIEVVFSIASSQELISISTTLDRLR